jgi:hypothetical protein
MKTSSQLPKFFRRLFGLLEIISPVVGVLVCFLMLALPSVSNQAEVELELGEVGLMPESGALTVQGSDSKAETISIKNLRGGLWVRNPGEGNGLLALTRWSTVPLIIAYAGFFTLLFDLLRRLFRNVERGESFTERSVRLVHAIGMAVILFTFLSAAATTWHDRAVANYLNQHDTLQEIKMAFVAPHDNSVIVGSHNFEFHFSFVGILAGLLVLSLGEVFRQGLVLKEDNDLTI